MSSLFLTWISIIKGDFDDNDSIIWKLFVLISTFISNVVLLNLIIAFMSDAYGNVMTTIFEKKQKKLNFIIIRHEKLMLWKRNIGKTIFIIWVDYNGNVDKKKET